MNEFIDVIDGEPVSVKQVADSVLAWAKENHLFAKGPIEDSVEDDDNDIELLPQDLFHSQVVKNVLKKRAINLVGYSDTENKVVIFTQSKLTKAEREKLPFQVKGGVKIEYELGGVASVRGGTPQPDEHLPYSIFNDRVACGSSIHPVNCLGAGTFGALVKGKDGTIYGLTNNHVSGACNCAAPGLPILCPGPIDANENTISPFTIGRHHSLLPINEGIPENINISQNWDAAIFTVEDITRLSSMQGQAYDTPADVGQPFGGMTVEKVGRTTGHTTGKIVAVCASPLPVAYAIKEYGISKTVFFEQVWIVVGDNEMPFSRGGDSGSLVVGHCPDGTVKAIGLVFAGNELRKQSFILPLEPIINAFEVDLVYDHNIS